MTSTSVTTGRLTTCNGWLPPCRSSAPDFEGVEYDVPFMLDAATLEKGQNFTFETSAGAIDVLAMPPGTAGYEDLRANAVDVDLGGGLVTAVCHLDDLIRMKRAAGRRKDRIELEILGALREERERQGLERT
jgi:hypothetical protein